MPSDEDDDPEWYTALDDTTKNPSLTPGRDWMDLLNDANSYLSLHLLSNILYGVYGRASGTRTSPT